MYFLRNLLTKNELMASTLLILVAVLARLIPHPPNFTPIIAIALFSGHILTKSNKAFGFLLPLVIMFIADILIGFHSTIAYVYLSIFGITVLGKTTDLFGSTKTALYSSTIGSILFFIITNAAVWFHSDMYTKSLTGLWSCYIMAIPFFHNTLLSSLTYMGVLWFIYTSVKKGLNIKIIQRN